uniref:Uncharacterized protein n=1 Tax=Lactuca sativa TaxID=4236 RepID=A0A9R1UH93_LACSA|nr:hypothetical protein LSAT_V11C900493910 [Lactuca sativa]
MFYKLLNLNEIFGPEIWVVTMLPPKPRNGLLQNATSVENQVTTKLDFHYPKKVVFISAFIHLQKNIRPSTKSKKKKGKYVPDVEDESESEIEEMAEVEDEYESEIKEMAEVEDEYESEIEEVVKEGEVELVVEPEMKHVVEPVVEVEHVAVEQVAVEVEHVAVEQVAVEVEHVEEQVAQPFVKVEQVAQPLKRQRKYSERITEMALKRVVITKDGCGLSVTKPVALE